MDKPTANAQLVDSAVLGGIAVARVAKKVRGDLLGLLAQLRDQLTAKLSSDAVMTDWQRQRASERPKRRALATSLPDLAPPQDG